MVGGVGILGRDAECRRIDDLIADPGSAMLLIEGAPGIGKTTVLQYGVAGARAAGYRVLDMRPGEAEQALTFAGLTALLTDSLLDELLPQIALRRVSPGQRLGARRSAATTGATGGTNREIAADLSVSVRTVESQLSAAYRKLGLRSRTELAATFRGEPG